MANKFIMVDYDKFKNKRETFMAYISLTEKYEEDEDNYFPYYLDIRLRHVSVPESEDLLLDVVYAGRDWFFLREGRLIININNVENITLEPHESYTKVTNEYRSCEEHEYYIISKEILKKICNAESVDIQISGESAVDELNANEFIRYAQIFYNGFYDDEAYREALEKQEKVKKGELDHIYYPDEDEDDETKGSGESCMVTLLLMCSAFSSLVICLFFVMRFLNDL